MPLFHEDKGRILVNYLGLKAEASEASFDAARLIPSLMISYIPRN